MDVLQFRKCQEREHAAWLDVGEEFKKHDLDMNEGGNAVELYKAVVKWGEELVQLRLNDPDPSHIDNALKEKRELFPGRFERGDY